MRRLMRNLKLSWMLVWRSSFHNLGKCHLLLRLLKSMQPDLWCWKFCEGLKSVHNQTLCAPWWTRIVQKRWFFWGKDEDRHLREFLQAVGLTKEQLYDESKVEIAPTCKRSEEGQAMLEDFKFDNATQTRKFYTSGTWIKQRLVEKCLDFNTRKIISCMVLGAQLICLWEL
jgi:hypothetical protein